MCLPVKPFKIEREWKHAGLDCAVTLNREAGFRCGYVRVPPTHPAHGKHYDLVDVDVHGGLTFADIEPCAHDDGTGWWFGFDCGHLGDALNPPRITWVNLSEDAQKELSVVEQIHIDVMKEMTFSHPGYKSVRERDHYWLQTEVERECESLAEQLAEKAA